MAERNLCVDHVTIWRWVQRYAPVLNQRIRREMRRPNRSWRVDETYVKVAGSWAYLYRAVDSAGETIEFMLSPKCPASGVLLRSDIPSVSPARGIPGPVGGEYSQRLFSVVVWARIRHGTCSPTWSGLGFDKRLTFDPPRWSSSHLRRIILPERSNLFKSHWSNQWLAR